MQICRACGQSLLGQDPCETLEGYASIYFHLTSIQLRDHEDPTLLKVCSVCVDKLKDFDRFRKVCLQVHWRLHDVKLELSEEEIHQETISVEFECKTEHLLELAGDRDKHKRASKKRRPASVGSESSEENEVDAFDGNSDDEIDESDEDDKPLARHVICHFGSTESLLEQGGEAVKSEITDEEQTDPPKPKKKRAKWGSLKKQEPREPIPIYSCDRCPRKFRVMLRLNAHKRTHDGLKPFECELCGKDFAKWNNLKTHHIQKHTDDKISLPCEHPGCGQSFATRQGLKRHRLRTHDPNFVLPDPMLFICDTCGKTFSSNGALKKHKYVHTPSEMPFVCGICAKKFPTSHKLKEHTMRHDGVKNHTCPYCGLRKTTMHELRTHMNNVHSKARSYPCDICTSVFSNIGNLNRHVKIVHLGLKPYVCQVCERCFGKSDHLKRHMKSHNIPDGNAPVLVQHAITEQYPMVEETSEVDVVPAVKPEQIASM